MRIRVAERLARARGAMDALRAVPPQSLALAAACCAAGYCAGRRGESEGAGGPVQSGVRSVAASGAGAGVYESERAVHEYLQFHFDPTIVRGPARKAAGAEGLDSALRFAQRVAERVVAHALPERRGSVLDVGCAVGGSCFELSQHFASVVGIDFSHAFVAACQQLQAAGELPYRALVSGDAFEECVARLPGGSRPERCVFAQGDACELSACDAVRGQTFDAVLAANLLCRLPDPAAFLASLPTLINSERPPTRLHCSPPAR